MNNRVFTKFRKNSDGFWDKYRWFIIIFLLALFCDAVSTIRFMLQDGADMELHFAIRVVSKIFGPILGLLIAVAAKMLAAMFVAIYCRRFAAYIFLVATIISFWAAWYNIWGIKIQL